MRELSAGKNRPLCPCLHGLPEWRSSPHRRIPRLGMAPVLDTGRPAHPLHSKPVFWGNQRFNMKNPISLRWIMPEKLDIKTVRIEKPDEINFILGQSHFIKTVEDIAEAVVGSVPGAKFGLAFCESSGECLVRVEGNDDELKILATKNALALGAGHSFILFLRNCFPINVLNAVKNIQEVCSIYCATANPAEVIIAESPAGRGIVGVIDGAKPKGVEGADGIAWRTGLLRKFGYKKG